MAVEFILGRSGQGKSGYCIDSIAGALAADTGDRPLLLLVPEQATYQAEEAILCDEKITGYSRLKVVSFDRLKFMLLGGGAASNTISRLGQQMIVYKILCANRDRLKIFGRSLRGTGEAEKLTATIIELHEYEKSSAEVYELARTLSKNESGGLAALKFADIALVYEQYEKFLKDNDSLFVNPDAQLSKAKEAVCGADFIKGAELWVDGFASFTVQQKQLLASSVE